VAPESESWIPAIGHGKRDGAERPTAGLDPDHQPILSKLVADLTVQQPTKFERVIKAKAFEAHRTGYCTPSCPTGNRMHFD
jgi:hypothetical protein